MFVTVHINREEGDEPIVANALRRDLLSKMPEGTTVVVTVATTEVAGIDYVVAPDPNPPPLPEDVPPAA